MHAGKVNDIAGFVCNCGVAYIIMKRDRRKDNYEIA